MKKLTIDEVDFMVLVLRYKLEYKNYKNLVDHIDAKLKQAYEQGKKDATEWQPIADAPKDGTHVMVIPPTWNGGESCAAYKTDEHAKTPRPYWKRLDDLGQVSRSRDLPPTHFRYVLPPPKEPT